MATIFTNDIMDILKVIRDKKIDIKNNSTIPFSLLSIFHDEISRKEVLHSKVIQTILNPYESHGYKFALLELFFLKIGIKDFNKKLIDKLEIFTEYPIDGRSIDILITWKCDTKKKAVIIENKLNYARDQRNQLNDYYTGISRTYEVEKVVYLHINPNKSARDTDTVKKVLEKTIDFHILKFIELLDDFITNCANYELIYNILAYRDLLKVMNINYYYNMKAQDIQTKLSPDEIKELIKISQIVNSYDWHNAKYSLIKEKLKHINPKVNLKGKYAEFFYEHFENWIELWSYDERIDLFICSYTECDEIFINNKKFNYYSKENNKCYYKSDKLFSFEYPFEFDNLITELEPLLKELSEYKEE